MAGSDKSYFSDSLPPHPNPLPQGEGAIAGNFLKILLANQLDFTKSHKILSITHQFKHYAKITPSP